MKKRKVQKQRFGLTCAECNSDKPQNRLMNPEALMQSHTNIKIEATDAVYRCSWCGCYWKKGCFGYREVIVSGDLKRRFA